jgi:hypothetical protein
MRPPEEQNFCVLTPYDPREGMSLKQAAERVGRSESSVKNWCHKYGVGRRVVSGVWVISKPALEMLLDDNHAALLAYHSGDKTSFEVREYFERTGVPLPKAVTTPQKSQDPVKATISTMSARLAG